MSGTTTATNGKVLSTTPRWTRPALEVVTTASWLLAVERPFALVSAAIQSLQRERIVLLCGEGTSSVGQVSNLPLAPSMAGWKPAPRNTSLAEWAQELTHEIEHGHCAGVLVLTTDPGLVCCVANKSEPIRAVAISTLAQAALATLSLQPNFVALEMPGRTYYEIRQVLRMFALTQPETQPLVKRGCACASAK